MLLEGLQMRSLFVKWPGFHIWPLIQLKSIIMKQSIRGGVGLLDLQLETFYSGPNSDFTDKQNKTEIQRN